MTVSQLIDSLDFRPEPTFPVHIVSPDSYTHMSGNFTDWTLADCLWYHSTLGWTFDIDGDNQRIEGIY